MTAFRAITTVYSYYLPEVREVVSALAARYPHDVLLRSVHPGLDDFHEPVMDRVVASHAADVPGLSDFPSRYPTAGSEEGIREYMTALALDGTREAYMLRGDYEGYREVAATRGIRMREIDPAEDPADLPAGHWFLSNPSARDGNILPSGLVERIAGAGHQLFYDLSYLGSTAPATFSLAHPNIAAAAISFSKTYGLFYSRIGFLFSRRPVPALSANKWFKNIFSLILADAVLTTLDTAALARKYKSIQAGIVDGIRRDHDLPVEASDAFLLAHLSPQAAANVAGETLAALERFRRADGYRFCLTPYFLDLERSGRPE